MSVVNVIEMRVRNWSCGLEGTPRSNRRGQRGGTATPPRFLVRVSLPPVRLFPVAGCIVVYLADWLWLLIVLGREISFKSKTITTTTKSVNLVPSLSVLGPGVLPQVLHQALALYYLPAEDESGSAKDDKVFSTWA